MPTYRREMRLALRALNIIQKVNWEKRRAEAVDNSANLCHPYKAADTGYMIRSSSLNQTP